MTMLIIVKLNLMVLKLLTFKLSLMQNSEHFCFYIFNLCIFCQTRNYNEIKMQWLDYTHNGHIFGWIIYYNFWQIRNIPCYKSLPQLGDRKKNQV